MSDTNVTVNNDNTPDENPAGTKGPDETQATGTPTSEGTGASVQGTNEGEPAQGDKSAPAQTEQPSTTPAESGVSDAPQQ